MLSLRKGNPLATTLIDKALATARTVQPGDVEKYELEVAKLFEIRDTLLPVEAAAKEDVERRLLVAQENLEYSRAGVILEGLKQLDMSVFSWKRDAKTYKRKEMMQVPALAYIPLSEGKLELSVRYGGDIIIPRQLPEAVKKAYTETLHPITRFLDWDHYNRVTLTYAYPGVIPTDIREIIQREKNVDRFEHLALVCEVGKWETRWEPAPPREYLDPILVGCRAGALWILGAFDPTPVEQYVLDEFSK